MYEASREGTVNGAMALRIELSPSSALRKEASALVVGDTLENITIAEMQPQFYLGLRRFVSKFASFGFARNSPNILRHAP